MKIKEYTPKESVKRAKEYLKNHKRFDIKQIGEGRIFLGNYHAKYQDQIHDKHPLVLVLRYNSKHTLGLNLHWIPYTFRMKLVKFILDKNKNNILKRKPLDFKYKDLRPFLKNPAYRRCVRLYITGGFSKNGAMIPVEYLLDVARLNNAIFSHPVKI